MIMIDDLFRFSGLVFFIFIFGGISPLRWTAVASEFDPCSKSVRLDGPGGTMEKVPVRDQGTLAICSTEATAGQLSAIQRKLGVKNFVEPSAMAIAAGLSAQSGINAFTHGGDPCEAIAYVQRHGVCSVDDVENRNNDADGGLSQKINPVAVNGLKNKFGRLYSSPNRCGPSPPVIRITQEKSLIHALTASSSDAGGAYKEVTKNCPRTSSDPKNQDPIRNLKLKCSRIPESRERGRPVSPHEFAEELDRLLDDPKAVPPIIGFCSIILTDLRKPKAPPAAKDSCGAHAALPIGKRKKDGRCQILLRNSWGTECDHYRPEMQSQCEPGKGNIWVDAETLTKNILEIIPPPL